MNRRRPDWILLVLMLSLAGCVSMDVAEPEIHVRHVPPTRADIIEAAIRLHDEPLNGHLWCDNLVSDAKPRTLAEPTGWRSIYCRVQLPWGKYGRRQ